MNKPATILRLLTALAATLGLSLQTCLAQSQRLRVMEYNVENLFDTLSTAGKADHEFTPQGDYHWRQGMYRKKLSQLARVIAGVGGTSPAALVALCEVENDSVLTHLTRRTRLHRLGYSYLISHSPDPRGINVALLYQPALFRPLTTDSLRLPPPHKSLAPTRDILHVAGLIATGDTLDVFILHLPSRKHGRHGDTYRHRMADSLRCYADSLMATRSRPLLLFTGDFNSAPDDALFRDHLRTLPPPASTASTDIDNRGLYLLSAALEGPDGIKGNYKYQGEWTTLDHFIVSGTLLATPPTITDGSPAPHAQAAGHAPLPYTRGCSLICLPCLLEADRGDNTVKPFRTFLGTHYHGGFSDHLPLFLDIILP